MFLKNLASHMRGQWTNSDTLWSRPACGIASCFLRLTGGVLRGDAVLKRGERRHRVDVRRPGLHLVAGVPPLFF